MAIKEFRLNPIIQEGPAEPGVESQPALTGDTRSTVEGQFKQMEQTHDRIREEELAARLVAQTIN